LTPPPPDIDAYRAALAAAGLAEHAPALIALSRPGVRLVRSSVRSDASVASSRIGGDPLIDPRRGWPDRDGQPLSFLAQIDVIDTG
jgi:hypothetical protein